MLTSRLLFLGHNLLTTRRFLFIVDGICRFADWMVKDVQTGEIFRADHLVEAVLEARLKGDKEARGVKDEPIAVEDDKKKKKKKVKSVAIKLEDSEVAEYENLLAQVRTSCCEDCFLLTSD